ncbi:MAG TPA: hypothetical protein VEN12_03715 [Verrucomicrobiae bacterium]|nr:hypothetical protein [Verrucomicrobiae bacterium]
METRSNAFESVLAPIAGGLVVLVTLLGLIGTAIRDPRPHEIPVGVTGPAALQITDTFNTKAPGTFAFTIYDSEDQARGGLDSRDVDAVLVVGAGAPRLIVAGAAGDAISGLTTAIFTAGFAAQGGQLTVEVTHRFAGGDPHGLVLFFLVLATIISTFVSQVLLFVRARAARLWSWIGVASGWAIVAGLAGVGSAAWIVGGYDTTSAAAMAGLIALTALATGAVTGGLSRLLGAPGLGLAGLVVVLLDLISSGGPAGPQFLPDAYRWLSPWMPAGDLFRSMSGVLYFDGNGVATPVLALVAWLVTGLVLMLLGGLAHRARSAATAPAG